MAIRLLILTDKYPIDADRSPTAWMLPHLRSLGGVAEVTVISLVRMLPRVKNLLFGGYDRRWFRVLGTLPKEEHPFPRVTVHHRRCFTLPDKTGWQVNPTLMIRQQRRWLKALLLRGGFDAVLVHYLHAAAPLACIAARTAEIPLWIDVNETMGSMHEEGQESLRRWLLKQLSAADLVIAQCSVQKADLQLVLPGKPIRVIPLAIEDAAPAAIPHDAPPLQCICVSRLDLRSKCVDQLLQAVAAVRSIDGTDLRLTIAGDGYLRKELQQLAGELGIAAAVRFVGWQSPEALREILRSQHFAAQPSEHESFGLAALEAAAAGLPLIAGASAGVVPDLVSAGAALRTFRSSSPQELAQAIRDIRDRWPELQRQAIEARGRIHERYSWKAHTSLYAALFRSLGK